MVSFRVGRLRGAWWLRGVTIAVAVLALATGLCLFDQDEEELDLCLGMLAVSLAVMPFTGLLPVGWAVGLSVATPGAVAVRVPDPPPRFPRSARA
jgi:hypothetical protein